MSKILTISIAAYNVERYIRKALDSLIDESIINDLEIFVVDDGGTDGTLKIAQEYAKQYPQAIFPIHKENGGYGSTINWSVEHASGKYFKLLDGDDWFDKEGLVVLLNHLKESNADMVLNPNIKIYEEDGTQYIRDNASGLSAGEYNIEDINIPGSINMHSLTYRTKLLRNSNLHITEHCFYTDTEFVLFPLEHVNRVLVMHEPVYMYRIGVSEQSMGYNGIRKHFPDHKVVLDRIFELYNKVEDKEKTFATWIYYRLMVECRNHYRYFCVLPMSVMNFRELKNYDKKLKCWPVLYKDVCEDSKMVKLLLQSKLTLYPLCCLWMKAGTKGGSIEKRSLTVQGG